MRIVRAHERVMRLGASLIRECSRFVAWHRVGRSVLALTAGLAAHPCQAYDVMLRWTVPTGSSVSGYRVHSGLSPRAYTQHTNVGQPATLNSVVYYLYRELPTATPTYVAVTAYNAASLESNYSNEKVFNNGTATPPRAAAGSDQVATIGSVVTLGTEPDPGVAYFWEQTGGLAVELFGRTSSAVRFSATMAGTFTFALTAYTADGLADRDSVNVTFTNSGSPTPTPGVITGMIRGSRKLPSRDRTGCQVEWIVASAAATADRFGLPGLSQACEDGDPSCDFESDVPGLCKFQVRVCLNNVDPDLPACTPSGITAVDVLSPRLKVARTGDSDPILTADLEALRKALTHLKDPKASAVHYIYAPPLEASQQGFCSAPFGIEAPVSTRRNRPSLTLKTRSTNNSVPRHTSVSQLQLTCRPRVQ